MSLRTSTFSLLMISLWVFVSTVSAGAQPHSTWQTIVSRNNEFSIALPDEIVVDRNSRSKRTTIVGGTGGVGYELTLERTFRSDEIMELPRARIASKWKESEFKIAEGQVRISNYETAKIYRTTIGIGTKEIPMKPGTIVCRAPFVCGFNSKQTEMSEGSR